MAHRIQTIEDVAWLLRHTRGFRGGQVTDVHVARRHLFDENDCCEVLAETTVTVVIRYFIDVNAEGHPQRLLRLARFRMMGVTDFSIFEQEGTNSAAIDALQAEIQEGRLRFWFDQYGEIYVICEWAELEEVAYPDALPERQGATQWLFQARDADAPSVAWLLEQLDRAGVPCVWKHRSRTNATNANGTGKGKESHLLWAGELQVSPSRAFLSGDCLEVQAYGPLDGRSFGVMLRAQESERDTGGRLLSAVAEILTSHFAGESIAGRALLPEEPPFPRVTGRGKRNGQANS
ncbi:hypothetical protein DNFV4_00807 [Nitrospira tepida]|uniref:Uncharacterized protein n=1 Tax=Nitrospira tepida TaxID=2973512 RepID=A0AA86T1S8_9BACT|nr:hypothetical protein [Nitrospira tepida]CAI4030379.1 hypothetical protein DNFV4_00807 [Nitrospira tepida]